jgi:hypothetical protein
MSVPIGGPIVIQQSSRSRLDDLRPAFWTRRNIFFYGSMTAALCIGALQMCRVRGGPLTNYGADLLGTIWLYAMFRQGRTIVARGRSVSAAGAAGFVFLGCTISEFAQRSHWLPGVYDPLDVLTYAVAVTASYMSDRTWGPLA